MPTIVRCNPWSMMRNLQGEVHTLFEGNLCKKDCSQWTPHVDVTEDSEQYRVIADLPGIKPPEIKVSIEDNVMTIQGARQSETRKEKEGYARFERVSGKFYRQFTLPENVDPKKIQAKSKHGVLEVSLPKIEPSPPKTIEIAVEDMEK